MGDSEVKIASKANRAGCLLTHEEICDALREVADEFALTKVMYFGSYADGRANEESDLDLLVEFVEPHVSLLTQCGLAVTLGEILDIQVDVIHAPLSPKSHITIKNSVVAYDRRK